MPIALYGHRFSQPCRAVEILLRELDIPYAWHEVDFANGETHQPWYAEHINAFETVPALVATPDDAAAADQTLRLGESHASMRWLCRMPGSPAAADTWYPGDRDPAHAARIDQWLDWHHANVRRYDMFHHIMNLHLTLPMLKREIQATLLRPLQDQLRPALDTLNQQLGGRGAGAAPCYLDGGDQPSIADLAIGCELYQIVAVGYRLDRFPALQRWLDALQARAHFHDVSEAITAQGQTIRAADGHYLELDEAFA